MSNFTKLMQQAAAGNAGGDFYPYTVDYSARFDLNSYLYRTGTSTSSTWTLSLWIKRAAVSYSDYQYMFSSDTSGFAIAGTSAGSNVDEFYIYDGTTGGAGITFLPQKYRDPSAWQHWVVSCNAGTATVYANNTTVGSSIDAFPLSTTTNGTIVGRNYNGSYPLGAYLAEVALVDGSALTPSSFAEDKNGIWVPKDISGLTFGNSGFYLDFSNSAALGTDVSGNGNNFTTSGLTSSDQMIDTPTNNYPVGNSIATWGNGSVSDGSLRWSTTGSNFYVGSTVPFPAGTKKYMEIKKVSGDFHFVISTKVPNAYNQFNGNNDADSLGYMLYYATNDIYNSIYYNGSATTVSNWTVMDTSIVVGLLMDLENNQIILKQNNVTKSTYSLPASMQDKDLFISIGPFTITWPAVSQDFNFGQLPFTYSLPTGYTDMGTASLAEPTIGPNSDTLSDENFNTVLWTGTSLARSITGVGFQPDLLWTKCRSTAESHRLHDAVRGGNGTVLYELNSNETSAEGTDTLVSSLDADGFSIAAGGNSPNVSGRTYVGWNWKANGSGVTNTDGSITSTVSANQDAGFSIVNCTAPASGDFTVGHGLGKTPDVIIVKDRDNTGPNWGVWHSAVTTSVRDYLLLNSTAAKATFASNLWGSSVPNSTVFGMTAGALTTGGAQTIAYAFAEVEGFSSFGKYTGNNSTDGPFVYTGFRPAFVMIKRTDSAGNYWPIHDSKRPGYNLTPYPIYANSSTTEDTSDPTIRGLDFLSNGIKVRATTSDFNTSGATYIYMAFAENPFKYANAR